MPKREKWHENDGYIAAAFVIKVCADGVCADGVCAKSDADESIASIARVENLIFLIDNQLIVYNMTPLFIIDPLCPVQKSCRREAD